MLNSLKDRKIKKGQIFDDHNLHDELRYASQGGSMGYPILSTLKIIKN